MWMLNKRLQLQRTSFSFTRLLVSLVWEKMFNLTKKFVQTLSPTFLDNWDLFSLHVGGTKITSATNYFHLPLSLSLSLSLPPSLVKDNFQLSFEHLQHQRRFSSSSFSHSVSHQPQLRDNSLQSEERKYKKKDNWSELIIAEREKKLLKGPSKIRITWKDFNGCSSSIMWAFFLIIHQHWQYLWCSSLSLFFSWKEKVL